MKTHTLPAAADDAPAIVRVTSAEMARAAAEPHEAGGGW